MSGIDLGQANFHIIPGFLLRPIPENVSCHASSGLTLAACPDRRLSCYKTGKNGEDAGPAVPDATVRVNRDDTTNPNR